MSIRTIDCNHALILLYFCLTDWTFLWNLHFPLTSISKLSEYRDDLGYDFSGSHDEDIIPFSHSFFRKLIIVMKSSSSDDSSPHIDGFQIRHRCDCTRSSYRMFDRDHFRADLFCWELISNCISRMMLSTTECVPESHIVELQHHAIDIEVEIFFSIFCLLFEYLYDIC